MSTPVQVPQTVYQGADFSFAIQWAGVSFSGASAKMQIRAVGGALLATFSAPSNGITFTTTTTPLDTVKVLIPGATSAAWVATAFAGAVYDLLIVLASGEDDRLIMGPLFVSPQVTV